MHVPPKLIRRCLLPASMALIVLGAVLLAAVMLLAVFVAPLTPRRRILRLCAFSLAYCAVEIEVLVRAGLLWFAALLRRLVRSPGANERWRLSHERLLQHALGCVLGSARRCFAFRWSVQDHGAADVLRGTHPALVLARHGGPGDSFTLVYHLSGSYGRSVRIVLKDLLQLDPALDVLLNRLNACFVRSGATTEERVAQLRAVAHDLGPGEMILLFPEGANWTHRRRARLIARLRIRHHHRAARAAELMEHVLPPRPSGVLACLEERPGLAVVIAAHTGLEHVTGVAEAWRSVPVPRSASMDFRLWQAGPSPTDPEGLQAWLTTEWAIVDEWIDAQKNRNSADTPSVSSQGAPAINGCDSW